MSFLPDSYEVPQSSGKYMKFEEGENRFRILKSPILGYEGWTDGEDGRKPLRVRMDGKLNGDQVELDSVKHFWAMPVWNYGTKAIQVLEITQKGIQRTLSALAKDSDWGSPLEYDVVVTRSGKGMETEYQVTPKPAKELDSEVEKEFKDTPINLDALYDGGDPFAQENKDTVDKINDEIPF